MDVVKKFSPGMNKKLTGQYTSIIVDEGQDLSPSAYRLLRALAGEEHENDIFIVGDSHQRIYRNKAVLSKCGINVRGRSSYLRINYRTTEEIRKFAFGLLNGVMILMKIMIMAKDVSPLLTAISQKLRSLQLLKRSWISL